MSDNVKISEINLEEFKEAIKFNIENEIYRPILGLGGPGIGKSDSVKQVAEEMGMQWIDLRLLLFTEAEIKGVPFPSEDGTTTKWLPMNILPKKGRDQDRGILILDELPAASKKVQTAIYQLVLDRRINEYVLPDGWFIVALGNREEDGGIYNELPPALRNRFEVYQIKHDFNVWKKQFAYNHDVDEEVIAYLNTSKEDFYRFEPDSSEIVFPTPRSWVAVSDILKAAKKIYKDREQMIRKIRIKIEATIGVSTSNRFIEFLKLKDKLISAEKILDGVETRVPKDAGERFFVLSNMTYILKNELSGKEYKDLTARDKARVDNAFRYIANFNDDVALVAIMDLIFACKDIMCQLMLDTQVDEFSAILSRCGSVINSYML